MSASATQGGHKKAPRSSIIKTLLPQLTRAIHKHFLLSVQYYTLEHLPAP